MSPHRIAMERTFEIDHDGSLYIVTLRTVTGRVVQVARRDKSLKGFRDYILVGRDKGAEKNLRRLELPNIKAVVSQSVELLAVPYTRENTPLSAVS